MASNSTTFDPFSQSFTLLLEDGTSFNVTIPDLDNFMFYSVQICINYAAQLGASVVLLVLFALLTKAEKRRTPIFILNSLSLMFNIIRNVLQCLYFTGSFSETYAYFAQDYSRVPTSAYEISITATVFTVLLLICIEISLLLQAQVVCLTLRQAYRHILFAISMSVAMLAIGFRLALCVLNSESTVSLTYLIPLDWVASAANITTTISICWFCSVFVTKLGFALYQRRILGLRRFGAMQILFIMGCQSLVIPVIFSILEYTTPLPSMDSNVLTLVAIFLPLSSMWAASNASADTKAPALKFEPPKHFSSFKSTSTDRYTEKEILNGPLSLSEGNSTKVSTSPMPTPERDHFGDINYDVEAQGISVPRVTRTFGITRAEV